MEIGDEVEWVAPHAGARIETSRSRLDAAAAWSLPTRERELKRHDCPLKTCIPASLPTRERELKRLAQWRLVSQ